MDIKSDNIRQNLRQRPLIFLDLETTGLRVQKHEIIEIGALKVNPKKPFNVIEELEIKVSPAALENADKDALKIVGYSKEEWLGAKSLKEALDALEQFGLGGVLVGYNINFDWAFLDKAYYSFGKVDPFYYHRLDVMPMAYLKLYSKKSLKRFSLGEVCDFLKIKRMTKHRALDDARTTYQIFKKLLNLK